jgi:predicted DNA-binding transcriptional regulator YafY
MPKNKDFALRIELIDECLRNNLQRWTLEKLVAEINHKLKERYNKTAGKHTIQNDIKYLIEEKNAPIAKKREGNVIYFYNLDKNFSIKNLPIQEEEVILLNDAINILSQVSEFQIVDDVKEIILKLQNTVSSENVKNPAIIQFEKQDISVGVEYIDDIFTAIKEKITLRISYQSFKAENAEECTFYPYLLKEYRNRWFVIGRKEHLDKPTNLALDRIKKIKSSTGAYVENDLFNPEVYFNNLIGVTFPEGAKIETIELKIAAGQVPYIKTKPIHHTQTVIKEYKNGNIVIELHLIINYEFRSVLLSYGCDITVIKPLELREQVKDIFAKGSDCYK